MAEIHPHENRKTPNKEIPFRNSVIHRGYIPSSAEAIDYGNIVMNILETSLTKLKNKFPDSTVTTFDYYGYKRIAEEHIRGIEKDSGIEQNYACVNIMTTMNVKRGREINDNDGRKGNIENQIINILDRRNPRKLSLLKDKPDI